MRYTSSFSDLNGKVYDVEIRTGSTTEVIELTMGGTPCIITSASEGIFTPIKSRSCTLEIVVTDYIMDLYDPTARGTKVKVFEHDNNKVIFHGFMTPCEYNQDYSNLDTITLEAIDGISTAKDFKWVNDGSYKTFFDIVLSILEGCNYQGYLYVPEVYTKINGVYIDDTVLKKLYASSANFIDDNDAHDPWTEYEVISEILKFLGWSLCPDGDDVWLVDYRSVSSDGAWYKKYSLHDDIAHNIHYGDFIENYYDNSIVDVSSVEAPGTPNLSIDDIYNKIEISDNLYKIEEISPDIDEEENHISVTREMDLGVDGGWWTRTETSGWLWWRSTTKSITGYDFQTVCRLKPNSGWKHRYFRMNDLSEIEKPSDVSYEDWKGYYDPYLHNEYNVGKINKYINTHCCLFQHYAHLKEEGKNRLPTSLDWTSILTFFVTNDKTPNFSVLNIDKFEKPVLEYEINETINWKPSTGSSWITIKGDLYYQYNEAKYGEKNRDTLNIVNQDKRFFTTLPVDKAIDIDEQGYLSLPRLKRWHPEEFNTGFKMWKMKLQIGDDQIGYKYWNGEEWTTYESTFYIKYNNNPETGDDIEFVSAFKWMSPVNTNDFKDKVGVDGYCVQIYSDEEWNEKYPNIPNPSPSFGKLKLTIYTPSLCSNELMEAFRQTYQTAYNDISWKDLPPVIFAKDFELGYVYTNSDVWYSSVDDSDNKNDKVYIGLINDNYVQDFDGLEFKLNTALPDKPISRSYVSLSNGYLNTMAHTENLLSDKEQEYNIVDMYLDHYSDRKVIYQCNIHGLYRPNQKFEYSWINGDFVIDTQSYDVRNDNNTIKIIAF